MRTDNRGEKKPGATGKRILIIARDVWIMDSLMRYSASLGFSVQSAESAKEAKEAVAKGFFEFIIADSSLPDSTGIELLRNLQKRTRSTTRILISSTDDEEVAITAKDIGIRVVFKSSLTEKLDQLFSHFFETIEPLPRDR